MTETGRVVMPGELSAAAKRLYDEKFRHQFEESNDGEFLAIDVTSEEAYLGQYPEEALEKAEKADPDGTFYLVRIGKDTTFDVGYTGGQQRTLGGAVRRHAYSDVGLQPAS